MKERIENEVQKWFKEVYKNGDISSGKNLLIYNVAQQFVANFLEQELKQLSAGKQVKILELEYTMETILAVDEIDFPVKLIGQADRIDEIDGVLRIIDYKTGKVEQKDLQVKDWSLITTDYKFSKSFQVLQYAFMYTQMNKISLTSNSVESGIISFKNLSAGFLKVNKRKVDEEAIDSFITELKQLFLQIYNTNIPFVENENKYF